MSCDRIRPGAAAKSWSGRPGRGRHAGGVGAGRGPCETGGGPALQMIPPRGRNESRGPTHDSRLVIWPSALERDRQTALRLVPVSRETEERLAVYIGLLARWRKTTNLISESTFGSAWTRHVADCAQLIALAPKARRWLDMGSGAGFPGLVIAIQLAGVEDAVGSLRRKRPAQMRVPARSRPRDRRAGANSRRAGRNHRPVRHRSCGRRHRAGLRPLADDARTGQGVDRRRRDWDFSTRSLC